MNNSYSTIRKIFSETGINFHDSGPAEENKGNQVQIKIADEQDSGLGVTLYFDIDKEGNEKFVCQE